MASATVLSTITSYHLRYIKVPLFINSASIAVTSGDVEPGFTYLVGGTGALVYNGTSVSVGSTFVGVNGVGKTTAIAKIGNRLKKQKTSVVLAAGDTFDTILEGYPWLELEDIQACLAYAHRIVGHERVEPFTIAEQTA